MLEKVLSIFCRKFCVSQCQKISREPFCSVSLKKSGSEKRYVKEGGEVKRLSVENFCLTVPKKS